VAKKAGRRQLPEKIIPEKVVDDTIILKRPRRGAKLREEVWQTADGEVTKYNLAGVSRGEKEKAGIGRRMNGIALMFRIYHAFGQSMAGSA